MDRRIQFIFSGFALVMLATFGWRWYQGQWQPLHFAMLGLSAAVCLLVFVRFVYIFNYSYALASIGNGALIWWLAPSPVTPLVAGAIILYGLRLGWFTWSRQHSASYAPRMVNVVKADEMMPAPAKLSLWLMCTLLLTYHPMSLAFAAERGLWQPGVVAGAALMLVSTLIEGLADWQKQQVKARDPAALTTHGLYRRWRHPNYAGEIGLQLGLLITGFSSAFTVSEFLVVLLAPAYIIILMVAEARRVDANQALRFGDQAAYRAWRERSGALLPRL